MAGNGIDDDANGFVDDVHGWDFVDGDAVPQDGFGHGTHVAGIIGAVGNNLQGVTGVAWEVSLMILRVQDDRGAGSTAAVLAALDYATRMRRDHGVSIVATNNSWDAPAGYSGVMESRIRALGEAGIMFVSAAGNQGSDVETTPRYPGGYDLANVINVAAASPGGDLARLSNWGSTRVDLAAPGTLVVSTWPGGGTGTLSGTSMAAPHVSGAIALLATARPGMTVDAMRAALLGSTRPIASHAGRTATGGMLDVRGALAAVGAGPPWTRGEPDAGAATGSVPGASSAVAQTPGLPLADALAADRLAL
ncbi:MAG TPA: peptidase S8, partial [Planctomycetaceae bacterium]|nr:peptidase S8 [Planctomycetaceae bacterium]